MEFEAKGELRGLVRAVVVQGVTDEALISILQGIRADALLDLKIGSKPTLRSVYSSSEISNGQDHYDGRPEALSTLDFESDEIACSKVSVQSGLGNRSQIIENQTSITNIYVSQSYSDPISGRITLQDSSTRAVSSRLEEVDPLVVFYYESGNTGDIPPIAHTVNAAWNHLDDWQTVNFNEGFLEFVSTEQTLDMTITSKHPPIIHISGQSEKWIIKTLSLLEEMKAPVPHHAIISYPLSTEQVNKSLSLFKQIIYQNCLHDKCDHDFVDLFHRTLASKTFLIKDQSFIQAGMRASSIVRSRGIRIQRHYPYRCAISS
ncbi:MAG: hypothetical protein LBM23_00365 [Propionibacteriaceae bacterium]|nr:hypothetical protein [Propionibacteriaceae bacterium]